MLSDTLVSWRCFSITGSSRSFSGKLLEVLERVVSRWLDLEFHLLSGLAARALACGPLAHQLHREVGCKITRLGRDTSHSCHCRHCWDREAAVLLARLSHPGLHTASTAHAQQHPAITLWGGLWGLGWVLCAELVQSSADHIPRSVLSLLSPAQVSTNQACFIRAQPRAMAA